MTNKSTQFTSENQPKERKGRGKSPKTKVIEALMRASKTEDEFWDMLVARALDPSDNIALKEVLVRLSPLTKQTMPKIEFDFNVNATPLEKANQILKAASDGVIPPDVANIFISSISSMMKIDEITEIANRLSEIEKALGLNNA
jgi:hypothetical protein